MSRDYPLILLSQSIQSHILKVVKEIALTKESLAELTIYDNFKHGKVNKLKLVYQR